MRESHAFPAAGARKIPAAMTALLLALGMGGTASVHSRDGAAGAQVSSLGAHILLAQPDGEGSNPAVAGPIRTQDADSALLVLVGGYASNASVPSDNYANTWVQQGHGITYRGYNGRFTTAAYVALAAKGGKNHRVTLAKDGAPSGEITAPFVEIRHAGVLQGFATRYAVPGVVERLGQKLMGGWGTAQAGLTSGSVTTTGPATLVAVWWGDAFVYRMTAVPDNGFKVIERFLDLPPSSGVQCAVAVRQVDRAGTYRVTWSGSPAQGAILWLFAFQARS
jgi:hypothetical protein